ncbi:hypothetical protein C0583_03615 [Candidatus Parcubacteria bacterium]|nr:MAG: hypothetical protein C0583_03615 [Candidatus Parcubacteria bacterium]
MKNTNQKGFTLIELLVVIAIIGLLSTMAVISLNSARAKARDARRLSDVKQLSTMLSLEAADNPNAPLEGCDTANDLTTDCTGPGQITSEFSKFEDPTTPDTQCTDPAVGDVTTCGYSIVNSASTVGATTTQIRFYLENDSGGLSAGLNTINSEGIFNP